ncbi:MAG: response regulator [Rhodocyclaceae bacterium]|nr:response regulator [Rhodocyclaceae bacterium]
MNLPAWVERLVPQRLYHQLGALFAVLFLVFVVTFAQFAARDQTELSRSLMQREADALAAHISGMHTSALKSGPVGREVLEALILRSGDFSNLQSVTLSDPEGLVLARVARDGNGLRVDRQTPAVALPAPGKARGDDALLGWARLRSAPGWVRVELDTSPITEIRRDILLDGLLMGTIATFLATGAVLLFLRRPLGALQRAADFAERLDTEFGSILSSYGGPSEVAQLSEALNWASIRLFDQNAALAASEQRYRSVVENLNEVVFQMDLDRRWTYLNRAWEDVTGFPVTESLGCPAREFVPEGEQDHFLSLFASLVAGEAESARGELRYLTRTGETRWGEFVVRALRDDSGSLTGFAGSATDVHDRRLAEELLRDQLHFVQALIEAIPSPIYFKDRTGHYLGFNKALGDFFGIRRDEWIGKTSAELLRPDQASLNAKMDGDLLRDGGIQTYEAQLHDRNSQVHDVLVHKTLFTKSDGSVAGILGIITDITERKHFESELVHARVAAEMASQAKSDFLANMSHEIRTPMNAIIGMTDLVLDTELSGEQREYLAMVKSSADSLLTLINEILDFSKIEAGKLDLEIIPFSLRDSVGMAVRTLSQRAVERRLDLRYELPAEIPDYLAGDPYRLRQVLINLLSNAIKFTPQGEVVVSVGLLALEGGNATLKFSVRDTGIGIDAEKQKIIFEAFSQVDSSNTRRYGGTGLGLTISSRLVKYMGGTLGVESEPGKGSTFSFTARFTQVAMAPGRRAQLDTLEALPVLVVDDNEPNRLLLCEMLRNWRMSPVAAESAAAARELLMAAAETDAPFRVVVLDALMPDMDGFTATPLLRQSGPLPGPTIIMLTSAGERGDAARCRELGISAYLMKPVVQSEMLDAIMLALGEPADAGGHALITRHSLRESKRRLSILLAEDNPVNRTLAVRVLEKLGHGVAVAFDGKEAVNKLKAARPGGYDVVFMDVQMPMMGGFEATEAIRAWERESAGEHAPHHIQIIAMTAHAMAGDREACLAAGMDDYVSKPVQTSALVAALARVEQTLPPALAGAPPARLPVASAKVYDRARLLDNLGGDMELLYQIAGMFLDDYPASLESVNQAVAAGDRDKLYSAAHSVKGMVSNFGAELAVAAAVAVEKRCRSGDMEGIAILAHGLADAVEELAEALRSEVPQAS